MRTSTAAQVRHLITGTEDTLRYVPLVLAKSQTHYAHTAGAITQQHLTRQHSCVQTEHGLAAHSAFFAAAMPALRVSAPSSAARRSTSAGWLWWKSENRRSTFCALRFCASSRSSALRSSSPRPSEAANLRVHGSSCVSVRHVQKFLASLDHKALLSSTCAARNDFPRRRWSGARWRKLVLEVQWTPLCCSYGLADRRVQRAGRL